MNQQEQLADWDVKDLLGKIQDTELRVMVSNLCAGPAIHQPSRFWRKYAQLNIEQLQKAGLDNFKRTINQNYFNWVGGDLKEQRNRLGKELGPARFAWAWLRGFTTVSNEFKPKQWSGSTWRKYRFFLFLLRAYTARKDQLGWLASLAEPAVGNPLTFRNGGRLISQDICNSLLELNGALEAVRVRDRPLRCAELGAGYGRVAYCMLHRCSQAKYTIIDIPPALYISQWYLGRTLPDRKIFHYRSFDSFASVREEFEVADVAFLLPQQAELLPDKYFDLFINISSLQEMTMEQIRFWFGQIDRLCRGRFYSKQWIVHANEIDNIMVKREDYPVPTHWRAVYNRECFVQPRFFEALYELASQDKQSDRN